MLGLCEGLRRLPEFQQLLRRIESRTGPVALGGLSFTHKAHVAGAVRRLTGRPILVVCADEMEARRFLADLNSFTGEEGLSLPSREFVFHNVETASREWEFDRMRALYALASGKAAVVVATVDALIQRTAPPETLRKLAFTLSTGKEYKLADLRGRLTAGGYACVERVEGCGQFAVRGGILDVFSPAHPYPVRVDFYGDSVDGMGFFDPDTQRRVENVPSALCLPAAETLPEAAEGGAQALIASIEKLYKAAQRRKSTPDALLSTYRQDMERLSESGHFPAADRYMALVYPHFCSALDYVPEDAVVFCDDSPRLRERVKSYLWQLGEDVKTLLESGVISGGQAVYAADYEAFIASLRGKSTVLLETFIGASIEPRPREILSVAAKQLPSYGGSLETAADDIAHYIRSEYSTVVLASTERRAKHLQELLEGRGIPSSLDYSLSELPPEGKAFLSVGSLSGGMEYAAARIAVITEGQLAAEARPKKLSVSKKPPRARIQSYTDLSVGDLVVHEHHGIGRFLGIEKMKTDNVERDYIRIQYSGADTLYVPATQLDLVSKYIGAGEDAPVRLNKLGGGEWQKTKTKAKSAARDMAKKLIQIYAERKRRPGFAFPPDCEWQKEFEDSFEYEETEAQLRCTEEIKKDMMQPTPMDRLLCGDVGFGKTEVAFRAVMKCVLSGKQAALLVPTTVLARQHYLTALRRFSGHPVKIAMLTRFQTPAESREILSRLRAGYIDLLIGTHRILARDVEFRDLGLMIVDEEQRFGVTHKERLKEISHNIDALTMTATPIPRTLNMALSGIRDMSVLEEAPRDRQPVQTYVLEHDPAILADAIRREIARGGQVYYLHNRIETIERTAARLSAQLPDVEIAIAHGQMNEDELNEVMRRMSEGGVQVLVCTTIIETGIDIPNVNTLIVEDADRLGLAQLHQIRGRVGRSPRHAYAYLTYKKGKVLSEVSTKRLSAMREFAGFGAGFKIALRDLEIRGAGNILGTEQSGHMVSVGYDMYLKLLEEAVLEERGERSEKRAECSADMAVSAFIPDIYIASGEERMDMYRRIAFIKEREDADDIADELCDRYGEPPESVMNLISIALLRADAARADITEITHKNGILQFHFQTPDFAGISSLCSQKEYRGRILLNAGDRPYISIRVRPGEDALKFARALVADYARVAADGKPKE